MAEEDEAQAQAPKAPKTGGMMVTAGAVLVLSLLAAGGGWFLGGMLGAELKSQEADKAGEHAGVEHDQKKIDELNEKRKISKEENGVVLLEPLTTNLAFPSDNWIRLEVALLFRDTPDIATSEQIHQDLLAYLRTVSLQQVEGPRGFTHLHQDLLERAELRSEGRVTDLMFRTFVIE